MVQQAQETLKVFELRYEGGIISQLELAQMQSQFETAASAIPPLEASIGQQENAISVLLGRNPSPIARGRALAQLELPRVAAGLPAELLARRPDISEAEQNIVAANAQIGAARALLPQDFADGHVGRRKYATVHMFIGPAHHAAFGVLTSVPIFTAGGIAGQVKQAEARREQALFNYQRVILIAFREVEDGLVALQKAREQLDVVNRRVAASRTYLEMAQMRYEEGYISLSKYWMRSAPCLKPKPPRPRSRGGFSIPSSTSTRPWAEGRWWRRKIWRWARRGACPPANCPAAPWIRAPRYASTPLPLAKPLSRPISAPSPKPDVEPGTAFPPIPAETPAK